MDWCNVTLALCLIHFWAAWKMLRHWYEHHHQNTRNFLQVIRVMSCSWNQNLFSWVSDNQLFFDMTCLLTDSCLYYLALREAIYQIVTEFKDYLDHIRVSNKYQDKWQRFVEFKEWSQWLRYLYILKAFHYITWQVFGLGWVTSVLGIVIIRHSFILHGI